MAYIEKDGFQFLADSAGRAEYLVLTGKNLEEEIEYIVKNKISALYLNYFDSKLISDLRFLKDLPFLQKINIADLDVDYRDLVQLKDLKVAIVSIKGRKQYFDFSLLCNIEILSVDWYHRFPDLSKNIKLKELYIWKYKPKNCTFEKLKLPTSLRTLQVTDSNITSFHGLEEYSIDYFEGYNCGKLNSLFGLNPHLKVLILENCRNIGDFSDLAKYTALEKIVLLRCGTLPDLSFLNNLKVKRIVLDGTNVGDGDLSNLDHIEFVSFEDRKHYNRKCNYYST